MFAAVRPHPRWNRSDRWPNQLRARKRYARSRAARRLPRHRSLLCQKRIALADITPDTKDVSTPSGFAARDSTASNNANVPPVASRERDAASGKASLRAPFSVVLRGGGRLAQSSLIRLASVRTRRAWSSPSRTPRLVCTSDDNRAAFHARALGICFCAPAES